MHRLMSRIVTSASRYAVRRLTQASDHEAKSWLLPSLPLYPLFSITDGNHIHVVDKLLVHFMIA
jgi:hypothetical protein